MFVGRGDDPLRGFRTLHPKDLFQSAPLSLIGSLAELLFSDRLGGGLLFEKPHKLHVKGISFLNDHLLGLFLWTISTSRTSKRLLPSCCLGKEVGLVSLPGLLGSHE